MESTGSRWSICFRRRFTWRLWLRFHSDEGEHPAGGLAVAPEGMEARRIAECAEAGCPDVERIESPFDQLTAIYCSQVDAGALAHAREAGRDFRADFVAAAADRRSDGRVQV